MNLIDVTWLDFCESNKCPADPPTHTHMHTLLLPFVISFLQTRCGYYCVGCRGFGHSRCSLLLQPEMGLQKRRGTGQKRGGGAVRKTSEECCGATAGSDRGRGLDLSLLSSLSLCNWIQLRWKCSEGALQFALLNNNVCSGVAWAAVHFERSRSSVQTHRGQCTGRLQPDHTGLWWKPVLLRTVKSPAGVFIYGFKQKKTTTKTLWAHEPWHDDSGHTQPQGLLLVKVSNVDCCSSSLSVWMIVI